MGRVDGTHAVVGVIRSTHTEAEGPGGPEGGGPPVIVVVTITVHTLRFAEFFKFRLKVIWFLNSLFLAVCEIHHCENHFVFLPRKLAILL